MSSLMSKRKSFYTLSRKILRKVKKSVRIERNSKRITID